MIHEIRFTFQVKLATMPRARWHDQNTIWKSRSTITIWSKPKSISQLDACGRSCAWQWTVFVVRENTCLCLLFCSVVRFSNVFGLCLGVFVVRDLGSCSLCPVFGSDVVSCSVFRHGDDISWWFIMNHWWGIIMIYHDDALWWYIIMINQDDIGWWYIMMIYHEDISWWYIMITSHHDMSWYPHTICLRSIGHVSVLCSCLCSDVGMFMFVFVFGQRYVLFVPQFVLNVCSCLGNGVRCQPCLKVHKSTCWPLWARVDWSQHVGRSEPVLTGITFWELASVELKTNAFISVCEIWINIHICIICVQQKRNPTTTEKSYNKRGILLSMWAHMYSRGPYGFIWAHMIHMDPCWLMWPIWAHMNPYGPLWAHMAPYGPYEIIWTHMGLRGTCISSSWGALRLREACWRTFNM